MADQRIVIVDDHPLFREALKHSLAGALPGLRIDEAGRLRQGEGAGGKDRPVEFRAAQVLVRGPAAPFATLLAERATATDTFRGWPRDEEGDRFGVLAQVLWGPLIKHETRDAP